MSAVTSRADIRRFMATLALAYRRILEATRFILRPPKNHFATYRLTVACCGFPCKPSEDKNVRNADGTWPTCNASERLGSRLTGIVLLRPRPNFAKRSGAGKRPPAKNCRLATAGSCNPPRHLDCGRLGDENDWPSHGQPGWLWCRAVAGGVSSVTSKADEEHGGAGCSSLPQHAGRLSHRDRRAGVHVRGRVGSVRSPARVSRHGRCKRDHLSLLLDALSLRFHAWAQCGTPGGMRAGGWSDRVAAAIDATET